MKHISEILPKALYKITGIEREYLLNYITDMEIEIKVLKEEIMLLKGTCCKCGVDIKSKTKTRKYCLDCVEENNRELVKARYHETKKMVECNCVMCGVSLIRTSRVAKTAKCSKCCSKAQRIEAKTKYSDDPMGEVLAEKQVKFDEYKISPTYKTVVRV